MQKPKTDFEPLALLSMEAIASRAFLASVRMRLFDQLETPKSPAQIAEGFELETLAAEGLLDLLEAREVLAKRDGRYVNSAAASEYLVSTSPFYQGECLELHQKANETVMRDMERLLRWGAKPEARPGGAPPTSQALAGIAQYSLRGGLQDTVGFVTSLPGFHTMRNMCDLGGSHGRYAMALLDENPTLIADIVDLPGVVAVAASLCESSDYGSRLQFVPCDLRSDPLPERAYDLILGSHMLYPFSGQLEGILMKIAGALRPGGWFVSHHLDPNNRASRQFRTAVDLTTCMIGHVRHVLRPDDLENAIRHAGLSNIRTGRSGFHAEGVIVATQKPLDL